MRILVFFVLILMSRNVSAQVSVMSYNIRYANNGDGKNAWSERREELTEMIRRHQPDILGVQEALHEQVVYLKDRLPGYSYVGVGRDDGKMAGEYCAIYYDSVRFSLIDSKTFWLSSTPEVVSVGWDAAMERIVTLASLYDKQLMDTLRVFNAHFDHMGIEARLNSAKLICSIADSLFTEESAMILMGDLNATPEEESIRYLLAHWTDCRELNDEFVSGPTGTFNGFQLSDYKERRIDYILSGNMTPQLYTTILECRRNGWQLSDHFPVKANLKVKRGQ